MGVDPGAGGGIVCILPVGVRMHPMPATEADVLLMFRHIAKYPDPVAVVEQVQGYIGGEGHPGATMFKFGMGYGGLRMALLACGIPYTSVTPAVWQKVMGVVPRKKNERKGDFKNRLKSLAQQLFPREAGVITLKTCDALLLAEYNRRTAK